VESLYSELSKLDPKQRIERLTAEMHVILRAEIAAVARILADLCGVRVSELVRYALSRLALEFPDLKKLIENYSGDPGFAERVVERCRRIVESISG